VFNDLKNSIGKVCTIQSSERVETDGDELKLNTLVRTDGIVSGFEWREAEKIVVIWLKDMGETKINLHYRNLEII